MKLKQLLTLFYYQLAYFFSLLNAKNHNKELNKNTKKLGKELKMGYSTQN